MRPSITFSKQQGQTGRTIPGLDYVSGLIFYCLDNKLPSGFSITNRIKQFFSITDAEAAGILGDYSDATAATGELAITDPGTPGDKVIVNVADLSIGGQAQTTQLCSYTVKSTDTSADLLAASIAAAINVGTQTHGYTAVSATGTITITAPKKFGTFLNSGTPLSASFSGGLPAPSGVTATPSTTGGTLAAGTYYYKVTALNAAGETIGSSEVNAVVTGSTGSVKIAWNAVSGATGYRVYKGTTAGTESVYFAASSTSYTDTNASGTAGTVPATNTTLAAGTVTQFTGGTASLLAAWHYQISEFFRMQPGSNGKDGLFVGFFTTPSSYTFSEISTLQQFANGDIRQVGIFKDGAYNSGDLSTIDTVCKQNDALMKNLSALYAADLSAVTDISTIADLSQLSANKASSIIGQDGGYLGNFLFKTTGKSVTVLGAALGALSASAVSEDFGQPVDKFNISAGGGLECDTLAFANGVPFSDTSITDSLLDSIDAKRHIFLQKYVGYSGSFFNDNHTAISQASDYAYINDNRVIDKAIRGIYIALLPTLKGRLLLNADGTLASATVNYLQNLALAPLFQMNRDGDLSAVSPSDVYINPAQNVKQTNQVIVNVALNEDGVARQIFIPIGFKPAKA